MEKEITQDKTSVCEMSREDLTKLNKTYETRLKPAYEDKNYNEIYRLLRAYPNLIGYLTKAQAVDMTKYLLEKNNSDITQINSKLEKTMENIQYIGERKFK
jgi:hypothetical protein